MNINQYRTQLSEALNGYSSQLKEEILYDFDEFAREAAGKGKSDQQIIAAFGSIEEILAGIDEEKKAVPVVSSQPTESSRLVIRPNDAIAADYIFEKSDTGNFSYTIKNRGFRHRDVTAYVYEENQTVYFELQAEKGESFSLSFQPIIVTISLPESIRELDLTNNTGDLQIQQINLTSLTAVNRTGDVDIDDSSIDNVSLKLSAGDLTITDCTSLNMQILSTAGDVEMTDSSTQNLKLTNTAGDIDISDCRFEQAEISSSAGDIELDDVTCINCNITAMAGDINLSDISCHGCNVSDKAGDIDVEFKDCYSFDLKCSFGDISVSAPYDIIKKGRQYFLLRNQQEIPVSISSHMGDIDIN